MNFEIEIDNIIISSKTTKSYLESKFPQASIDNYVDDLYAFSFSGSIFQMKSKSKITAYFKRNKIIEITIFPSQEVRNDEEFDIQKSYNLYNKVLEDNYGRRIPGIFNKEKKRRFTDAIIKHYLFERFGLEEVIEIYFKIDI